MRPLQGPQAHITLCGSLLCLNINSTYWLGKWLFIRAMNIKLTEGMKTNNTHAQVYPFKWFHFLCFTADTFAS